MALSVAAAQLTLPGTQDLEVVQADKRTMVRAARDFASGTLLLLPQVARMQQIASQRSHPHKVAVSVGAQTCCLTPWWKPSWPQLFWAARRQRDADGCNTVLQSIKESVVQSVATTAQLTPPTQRYVATEIVYATILKNVKAISAGEEVVLHVPLQPASPDKRDIANCGKRELKKSAKRDKTWLDNVKKGEALQRR
jgi:hypothetical protein